MVEKDGGKAKQIDHFSGRLTQLGLQRLELRKEPRVNIVLLHNVGQEWSNVT